MPDLWRSESSRSLGREKRLLMVWRTRTDNFNGLVVLPYAQGVSEKIGRILKREKVVAYKPQPAFFHVLNARRF